MFIFLIILFAIILAIVFWYITIPLIVLGVILFYQDDIKKSINERKKKKEFKNHTKNHNGEKYWNLIQEFSITNSEAETIFGKEFMINFPTRTLYPKCVEIVHNHSTNHQIPKYLLLKLGDIFDKVSEIFKYEVFTRNYYSISKSRQSIEDEILDTQNILKNLFENYTKSGMNDSFHGSTSDYHSRDYNGDYYDSNYQKNHSRGRYDHIKQKRIQERLEKFQISESDAQIIFGKNWRQKLGKPEWKFFYDMWSLEIKITYDYNGRYKRKFGNLFEKIIEIIRIVDEENPEMASQKNTHYQNQYDDSFDDESYDYLQENLDDEQILWAYTIFDLKQGSTITQIKQRYRELSLRYHPDRNHSLDATKKMSEINSAYEVLSKIGDAA